MNDIIEHARHTKLFTIAPVPNQDQNKKPTDKEPKATS